MFVRRITRREDAYVHEKFAQKILKKWEWGDAPPSDDLKDIYLLHTERTKQREARLRAYKETVREMVADGLVSRRPLGPAHRRLPGKVNSKAGHSAARQLRRKRVTVGKKW